MPSGVNALTRYLPRGKPPAAADGVGELSKAQPGRTDRFHLFARAALTRITAPASLAYVGSFGAAKLLAYVVPIVLAILLPAADYVAIEYALALGSIGGMLLGLGLPSAIPQFTLYRDPPVPLIDLAGLQAATLGGLMVMAGALAPVFGFSLHAALIPLMIGAYLFQYAGYQYALTATRPSIAVWISNLTLLVAMAAGVAGWAAFRTLGAPPMVGVALVVGALTLACATALGVFGWRNLAPEPQRRLREALAFGIPVAINGMVATWSVSTIRIYAGWSLPAGEAASLLFDFRLASILITVHLLVSTAIFRRLYVIEAGRLDKWVCGYFAVALAAALAFNFLMVAPLFQTLLGAAGERSGGFSGFATLFVIFWSVTAFIDVLVNRSGRAMRSALANGAVAAGFALFVKSGLLTFNADSLGLLCCTQLAAVIAVQAACLSRHELPWRTLAAVIAATTGGFVVLASGLS